MKIATTFFLFVIVLIISCTNQPSNISGKFTIKGQITGQDTGKIVLRYLLKSTVIYDTAIIKNGKFTFTGNIVEPTLAQLKGGDYLNRVEVYLETGLLKISLKKDKYEDCIMTGSKTQNDLNRLEEFEKPVYEKLDSIRALGSNMSDSIKKSKTNAEKFSFEKKKEEIDKLWSLTRAELNSTWLKFVLENPTSYVTPYYLNMLEANEVIPVDSLKSIFNNLDINIQNSNYGNNIKVDIRKKENTRIGAQAPSFKATDLNQQQVTLLDFKGKNVVLMDFWASWCVPCREDIPALKDLYKKFHSKGFEIIAVTIDMNKNAWKNAVTQDTTSIWYQIPVANDFAAGPAKMTDDDIFKNYFVQAIPYKILINKEGIIIGRWGGGLKEPEISLESRLEEIHK